MTPKQIESFSLEQDKYLKNVAVDNVIFGYHDKELKILLQKPYVLDQWTVTGGYILKTESIEQAANRVVFTRTGLESLFLEQFRSFGSPERKAFDSSYAKQIREKLNIELRDDYWIFDYFVSVGFYTLTEFSAVTISKGDFDEECQWWPINELPALVGSTGELIVAALKALRMHMSHYPIGYELLPKKFTVPEIHRLYETILGRPLDIRNFLRRLLATQIIEKLNETKCIGGHRSPFLYQFNKLKYDIGLEHGAELAF